MSTLRGLQSFQVFTCYPGSTSNRFFHRDGPLNFRFMSVAIGALLPNSTASAVEVGQMVGHSIEIVGEYPDRIVRIDGREMHKNAILTFG